MYMNILSRYSDSVQGLLHCFNVPFDMLFSRTDIVITDYAYRTNKCEQNAQQAGIVDVIWMCLHC